LRLVAKTFLAEFALELLSDVVDFDLVDGQLFLEAKVHPAVVAVIRASSLSFVDFPDVLVQRHCLDETLAADGTLGSMLYNFS